VKLDGPERVVSLAGDDLTIVVSRESGRVMDLSLAEGCTPGQDLAQLAGGSPTALP
jgi:hypothetical protein